MVGHRPLEAGIGVRVPAPQPVAKRRSRADARDTVSAARKFSVPRSEATRDKVAPARRSLGAGGKRRSRADARKTQKIWQRFMWLVRN
jgi:hypothetical protein